MIIKLNNKGFGVVVECCKKTINEYAEIDYNSLAMGQVNLPKVYHCAREGTIKKIFEAGFDREFTAANAGNMYGAGVYSTYRLDSSIRNANIGTYGRIIIECYVTSYDRFIIFNKEIAQEVYGENWHITKQLELLFPSDTIEKLKVSGAFNAITSPEHYTSQNIQRLLRVMGGLGRSSDGIMDKYNIKGYIFYGANDGHVAVIRDFKAVIPYRYSTDYGKTWNVGFNESTYQNTVQNVDSEHLLGQEKDEFESIGKYINGYIKVVRKTDKKQNYINKNKDILSPIWFDLVSPFNSENGKGYVKYRGVNFYIDEDGIYEDENERFPVAELDEIDDYIDAIS